MKALPPGKDIADLEQRQVTPPLLHRTARKQVPETSGSRLNAEDLQESLIKATRDESITDDDDDVAASTASKSTEQDPQSHRAVQEAVDHGLTSRPKENRSRSTNPAEARIGLDGKSKSHTERIANSKFNDLRQFKKKAKVGKIGGKAKAESTDTLESSQSVNASIEPANLEQLVDRHPYTSNSLAPEKSPGAEAERSTRARKNSDPLSSPPEETGKERADENRERIKHALEAKAAAPPKKKRRF